ncbi:uncharacterized protein EDB91DRAFT_1336691 [Suillus paluster]|uniref:uncharacterized protein n=1 Tax=Suillus paluster TaxID=48578 RepID=UPI001B87637E|nr:uncharacterized protein EDB91DRAFT_1336691 [Suillus paluster]KAG1739888.1 hypothetical protein EDB91DRAFT_1336691 [Suillus paluster]
MSAVRSSFSDPPSDAEDEEVDQDGVTMHGLADALEVYMGYLPSFRAHLRDTRAHLVGSIPFYDGTGLIPSTESTPAPHTNQDDGLSPPEQVEGDPELPLRESNPTVWSSSLSSWSQSEVDVFFHAVSVYSRWRPDLIADALKTKGEIEVVEFLVTLDSCARSRATETKTDQDSRDIVSTAPAAIEVSDEWVAAEETMATALVIEEDHGEIEELEALRRKRVREARADMIPRGKRRRVTAGIGEDELMASEDSERDVFEHEIVSVEVVAGKALFEKWHARKIAAWERDDLLKKLEDMHLQVLDAILREDEEAQKGKSLSREGSADVISQDPETEMDLTALSPTSRRRLTKRLYMRRKRAQLRGEDVAPVGLARMKPGRKGKEKVARVVEETEKEKLSSGKKGRRMTMTPDLTEPDPEADDDDLGDAGEATTKKRINVGGKTRYQKIRSEFEHAGINASYLSKHGMDLFHLGRLGKLVGIYKSFEQYPEDDVGATYISTELIRYLQALVVSFTTDVIHRATMWKEQADELKGQKKVWKSALHQINQPAVEHALKTTGVRSLNRQEHFSKLLDNCDLLPDTRKRKQKSSHPAGAEDERASASGHSPDAQSYDIELSPHRTIYTPALLAPASFDIGFVDTFFPGYDACFPSKTRISVDSHEMEDSLLLDETDEEALKDELREDEMLDQADAEAGKKVEEQLWAEVEREEGDDASVASER